MGFDVLPVVEGVVGVPFVSVSAVTRRRLQYRVGIWVESCFKTSFESVTLGLRNSSESDGVSFSYPENTVAVL